jgi:hydrogenase expression/formation protein HypC
MLHAAVDLGATSPSEARLPVAAARRKEVADTMCLAVPGQVIELTRDEALDLVRGKARFGGIVKDVNLTFTPGVQVGDYVVVHVGFALSRLEPEEAREVFRMLEQLGETRELAIPEEGA